MKKHSIKYNRNKGILPNRKRKKTELVFEQDSINKILYSTTLYSVIKDYIGLKKNGADYVGRCPFCKPFTYNDSFFRVSDKKHLYKCFECGFGGTLAVSFIMKYHNIPFDTAISYLNKKYHNNQFKLIVIKKKRKMKPDSITDDLPF